MTKVFKFVNQTVKSIKFMMIIYQNVFADKELTSLMEFAELVIVTVVIDMINQLKDASGDVELIKFLLMLLVFVKRIITNKMESAEHAQSVHSLILHPNHVKLLLFAAIMNN